MLPRNFSPSSLEKPLNRSSNNQNDVNPFAQGLRLDLQRFLFFFYLYEIQKMEWIRREKVASLWKVEWKGFDSKCECVWMENDDDNDGVQVGLKAGLSLAIF